MKSACNAICVLLMFLLALGPTYGASPTKPVGQSGAKAKVQAKERAKAKVAKAKAKAKSKARAKARAKAKAQVKSRVKESAAKPVRYGSSVISPSQDPADESSLDAEIAAARMIVSRTPNDVAARERLARASIVLIDWLLRAEAVRDAESVQRLTKKLGQDLYDTGWRVEAMSKKGDPAARQAAGFLFGRGMLLNLDPEKSCTEFVAAADKLGPSGWHAAQCLMATSPDAAWVQMERAAQRGHAGAQEWMGRRCLGEFGWNDKDIACAMRYLGQSSSLGRPRAQTLLAYLLASGEGGPAEHSRAILLYAAAAEKGDADAQNNLGEIYEAGRGVARNPDEAMRLYEIAAAQGLGLAQFNAGRLWAIGVGKKRDPVKARAFLMQAEANGISYARQALEWLDRQNASALDEASAGSGASTPGGGQAIPE